MAHRAVVVHKLKSSEVITLEEFRSTPDGLSIQHPGLRTRELRWRRCKDIAPQPFGLGGASRKSSSLNYSETQFRSPPEYSTLFLALHRPMVLLFLTAARRRVVRNSSLQ